ncbi:hypothetical protein [Sporocytophaga myxococcoides]|uniref:hypothetical protein n=1 Tax=Sporocytophaga myxococcoides TaxID=153721 RepID=UPI00048F5830|nr:hypothetical protein [Sporocytophaga myxococcoides]
MESNSSFSINEFLSNKDHIRLKNHQYALLKYVDTENIISIMWKHEKPQLSISYPNDLVEPEVKVIDLSDDFYVLVNSEETNYEALFLIKKIQSHFKVSLIRKPNLMVEQIDVIVNGEKVDLEIDTV